MNLAPLKYRDVLETDGGPIKDIVVGTEYILGKLQYSAHAFLKSEFQTKRRMSSVGDMPDGVGTATDPVTAKFRALSEAMERWAFRACSINADMSKLYGFDYDSTTNGMGAFPGLFDSPARLSANREAIERHCLILWWEGYLAIASISDPFPGVRAIEFENPFGSDRIVLLWQFVEERYYSYGFGLGSTIDEACWRAGVEMHRTDSIVRIPYQQYDVLTEDMVNEYEHVFERRILHFSRPDGFAQVLDRMETPPTKTIDGLPKVLLDRKVSGPWDRYVTVWRTVYEQPSREFTSERTDYFFW